MKEGFLIKKKKGSYRLIGDAVVALFLKFFETDLDFYCMKSLKILWEKFLLYGKKLYDLRAHGSLGDVNMCFRTILLKSNLNFSCVK